MTSPVCSHTWTRSLAHWPGGPSFSRRPLPKWLSSLRKCTMRVLGISPLDKDATASFVEDGLVVFACGEERLSRVKLQGGFPHRAVRLGLERTGWDPASIDAVAYAFFDGA